VSSTVVRQARTRARTHPQYFLALKAALAAMLAWLVVQPFGGFVVEYSYYPPLGALSVVSTSVVRSARNASEVVVAILLGAVLALVAEALPLPEPIALGVAIVAGVLVGASGLAGGMGSWVRWPRCSCWWPVRGNPIEYTRVRDGGLTAVGARWSGWACTSCSHQLPGLTPAG